MRRRNVPGRRGDVLVIYPHTNRRASSPSSQPYATLLNLPISRNGILCLHNLPLPVYAALPLLACAIRRLSPHPTQFPLLLSYLSVVPRLLPCSPCSVPTPPSFSLVLTYSLRLFTPNEPFSSSSLLGRLLTTPSVDCGVCRLCSAPFEAPTVVHILLCKRSNWISAGG